MFNVLLGSALLVAIGTVSANKTLSLLEPAYGSNLSLACVHLAGNKHLREGKILFNEPVKSEGDCCLAQTASHCFNYICRAQTEARPNNGSNWLSSSECDFLGEQARLYYDNLVACHQAYGKELCVARLRSQLGPLGPLLGNKSHNTPPKGGSTGGPTNEHSSGSGMPLWLIILLVVLILVACGMIFFVVHLFRADKTKKRKSSVHTQHSKHSKQSKQKSSKK